MYICHDILPFFYQETLKLFQCLPPETINICMHAHKHTYIHINPFLSKNVFEEALLKDKHILLIL